MFLEVNDKYEAFFGWTRDDLVGHTTLEVGLWVDLAAREAWLEELRLHGSVLEALQAYNGDVRAGRFPAGISLGQGLESGT